MATAYSDAYTNLLFATSNASVAVGNAISQASSMYGDAGKEALKILQQNFSAGQSYLTPYRVAGEQGIGTLNNLLGVNGTAAQTKAINSIITPALQQMQQFGAQTANQAMASFLGVVAPNYNLGANIGAINQYNSSVSSNTSPYMYRQGQGPDSPTSQSNNQYTAPFAQRSQQYNQAMNQWLQQNGQKPNNPNPYAEQVANLGQSITGMQNLVNADADARAHPEKYTDGGQGVRISDPQALIDSIARNQAKINELQIQSQQWASAPENQQALTDYNNKIKTYQQGWYSSPEGQAAAQQYGINQSASSGSSSNAGILKQIDPSEVQAANSKSNETGVAYSPEGKLLYIKESNGSYTYGPGTVQSGISMEGFNSQSGMSFPDWAESQGYIQDPNGPNGSYIRLNGVNGQGTPGSFDSSGVMGGIVDQTTNNPLIQNMMSYLQEQGQRSYQNTAASKGMLNSGRAVQELQQQGQGFAAQNVMPLVNSLMSQVVGGVAGIQQSYLQSTMSGAAGLAGSALSSVQTGLSNLVSQGNAAAQAGAQLAGAEGQASAGIKMDVGRYQADARILQGKIESDALNAMAQIQFGHDMGPYINNLGATPQSQGLTTAPAATGIGASQYFSGQ